MEENDMVIIDIHEDATETPPTAPTPAPLSSRTSCIKHFCAAMTIAGIIVWNIVSKI